MQNHKKVSKSKHELSKCLAVHTDDLLQLFQYDSHFQLALEINNWIITL